MKKSVKVPNHMQERFDIISGLINTFCANQLNEEYYQLAREATAALCRKRPSPLEKGDANSWACGIIYALGFVNFLFDKNTEPYISATDLCDSFSVSRSNGSSKSKMVRDILKMYQMDTNWSLPSLLDENPMVWLIQVNGLLIDARNAPYEIQKIAYEKGLIP